MHLQNQLKQLEVASFNYNLLRVEKQYLFKYKIFKVIYISC